MNKNKSFFAELKQNIEDKKIQSDLTQEHSPKKENKFDQGLNLTKEIM